MGFLTKDQILGAPDRRTLDVEVPEWGGTVRLASMSGTQRDRYEELFLRYRNGTAGEVSVRAALVAACAIDPETGDPLFKPEHLEALGKKSGAALNRLFSACLDLNVLTETSAEAQRGN